MRFKLDENLPVELAAELRAMGHDTDTVADEGLSGNFPTRSLFATTAVREVSLSLARRRQSARGLCGEADPAVVEAASVADRILLTLDKAIADVRSQRRAAVVLFRPDSAGRRAVLSFVLDRIPSLASMDLEGRVTVVGPSRIRLR